MLKPVIKASALLAVGLATFTSPSWALTKPSVPTTNNAVSGAKDTTTSVDQSIPLDNWTSFQQGFNTLLQLDSAMTQQFFANPVYFNHFRTQENPKQYVISLNVPGVDPRQIKVSISQGILFVQAKDTHDNKSKKNERSQYDFFYRVTLPNNVNPQKVSAILKRGVLQITIEKTNKLAATTEIPIKEIA